MVEFVRFRKCEKRNRTDFYWEIVKVCACTIRHGGIETFWAQTYKDFELYQVFIYKYYAKLI